MIQDITKIWEKGLNNNAKTHYRERWLEDQVGQIISDQYWKNEFPFCYIDVMVRIHFYFLMKIVQQLRLSIFFTDTKVSILCHMIPL